MLEGSEFSLAGGVAYNTEWSVESADDGRMGDRQSTSVRQPFINLRGSFLYGISDEIESMVSLEYSPAIIRGSRTFSYRWPYGQVSDACAGTLHRESLLTKITLTYPPASRWEVSLQCSYADFRRPSTGSETTLFATVNYPESSSMRSRILDIRAGISIPGL